MEKKTLELTEFKVEDASEAGGFEGMASMFGTVDSYGDTIDPGAYKDTIPEFLNRGFLGWGHDWTDPIGYFTDAKETRDGLWVKGEFHTDPQAQAYRTRVKERAAAGKFMGMSIGYDPLDFEFRTLDDKPVRALTRIKLHEVSMVTVPAERGSHVTRIKADENPLAALMEVLHALKASGYKAEPASADLLALWAELFEAEEETEDEPKVLAFDDPKMAAYAERYQRIIARAAI